MEPRAADTGRYKGEKVNEAYDTFLNVFLKKYDKHCPIIKINTKHVNSKKPWFTNGLRNACHKKNNFFSQFLKKRSHISRTILQNVQK